MDRNWRNKYQRVLAKRKRGNIVCFWCEQPIPADKLRKSGRLHPPQFCSQACATAKRNYTGQYKKLSQAGNAAQQRIKAQTGQVPGYEQRREALIKSNREHPRRRRKESAVREESN
jgi:hypothetical protein